MSLAPTPCHKELASSVLRWWPLNSSFNFVEGVIANGLNISTDFSAIVVPEESTLVDKANSVEMWINLETNGTILAWTNPENQGSYSNIRGFNYLRTDSTGKLFIDTVEIFDHLPLNVWHHIAITQFAGNNSTIYLNGERIVENIELNNLGFNLYVGGVPFTPSEFIFFTDEFDLSTGECSFASGGAIMSVDDIVRYSGVVSEFKIQESAEHQECGFKLGEVRSNQPPYADAGKYKHINNLSERVRLDGVATDDVAVLSTTWSVVSAPASASVTFDNNKSITPSVSCSKFGRYIFRLDVSDGEFVTSSHTEVDVSESLCLVQAKDVVNHWSFNGYIDDYFTGVGNDVNNTQRILGVGEFSEVISWQSITIDST